MTNLAREFQEFQARVDMLTSHYHNAVAHVEAHDSSIAYPVMAPSHTEYHTGTPQNAELANNSKRD